MGDAQEAAQWRSSFDDWAARAQPMLGAGNAKEAFADYPWFSTETSPFTALTKPAADTVFGLITTGGYSVVGEQEPMRAYPTFGDEVPEFHRIAKTVDPTQLVINHPGYDHKYAVEDHNVNLPFDRLAEMVADGEIGGLADNTLVLMGLQVNVQPLINETIPQLLDALRSDGAEAALLVPS